MKVIADLWPLLLVAGCGFLVYAIVRLTKRFSPGAISAGPKRPPDATHLGQSELADDLRRIDRRLDTRPDSLIKRIQRSCIELGVPVHGIVNQVGGAVPPEQHIESLLARLEAHLELAPLTTAAPDVDDGAQTKRRPFSSNTQSRKNTKSGKKEKS